MRRYRRHTGYWGYHPIDGWQLHIERIRSIGHEDIRQG